MKRMLPALATGMALTVAAVSASPAEAGWRHRGRGSFNPGAAAAIGIIGGLALGSALAASSRPAYAAPAPVYGYGPYRPVYGGAAYAAPVYGEHCYIMRKRYVDEWGDVVIRKRKVCE